MGSRLATCCEGAAGGAEFNWESRLASMAMSPKGLETTGAVEAGVHWENTESGGMGPSQCRAQTLTAPARAKAATPGTSFETTR